MSESIKSEIAKIYKSESGQILASLVRLLGDLDLAEERVQEAFKVALEKWRSFRRQARRIYDYNWGSEFRNPIHFLTL